MCVYMQRNVSGFAVKCQVKMFDMADLHLSKGYLINVAKKLNNNK